MRTFWETIVTNVFLAFLVFGCILLALITILVMVPWWIARWCLARAFVFLCWNERELWREWTRRHAQPRMVVDRFFSEPFYDYPSLPTPESRAKLALWMSEWMLLRVRWLRKVRKQGVPSWRIRTMACLTS